MHPVLLPFCNHRTAIRQDVTIIEETSQGPNLHLEAYNDAEDSISNPHQSTPEKSMVDVPMSWAKNICELYSHLSPALS